MTVTNYYSVGGDILGEKTTGGNRLDYLTDALGSVTATLNQSAEVVNTYRYKPYGSQLAKTGTAPDPAFTWVGSQGYRQTSKKYADVYVRARHYSTTGGRWTTQDILEKNQSLYLYARSMPIMLVDVTGLKPSFGHDGNGCSSSYQGLMRGCCWAFNFAVSNNSKFVDNVVSCVLGKINTPDAARATREALKYIGKACDEPKINVCIWCFDKNNNPPQSNPPWPRGCHNRCKPDPETHFITRAFTPISWPSEPYPINADNTGCEQGGGEQSRNCTSLRDSSDGTKCTNVIVMCNSQINKSDGDNCATLYHELAHAGGLGYAPGHESTRRDLVYAIQCCTCQEMYGSNSPSCTAACSGFNRP